MCIRDSHISVDAPFVEGEDNSLLDVLVNDDSPMADRSLVNDCLLYTSGSSAGWVSDVLPIFLPPYKEDRSFRTVWR